MLSMTARLKQFNTRARGCIYIVRIPSTGNFKIVDMRLRTAYNNEGTYYADNLDDAIDTGKAIAQHYTLC